MALIVAIQMDPIEKIDIGGDSTFAMAMEAQARGHTLLYYGPRDLTFRDGAVSATARPLQVRATKDNHISLGDLQRLDLSKTDVVLMQQKPPNNKTNNTTTQKQKQKQPKTQVGN